jgi:DNA-binding HxlR family transcriptional regulator
MAVKRDQDSVRTGRRRFSNESKLGFIENLDEPEANGASYRQGCNGRLGIHVCRQAENEWPAQLAISLIQGKWKMRILSQLQHGPIRLSQLRKMFPGASKKMLTQHLREMEEDGLIIRTDLSARLRHVEYSLEDFIGRCRVALDQHLDRMGIATCAGSAKASTSARLARRVGVCSEKLDTSQFCRR